MSVLLRQGQRLGLRTDSSLNDPVRPVEASPDTDRIAGRCDPDVGRIRVLARCGKKLRSAQVASGRAGASLDPVATRSAAAGAPARLRPDHDRVTVRIDRDVGSARLHARERLRRA